MSEIDNVFRPIKIGSATAKTNLFLAPLAGFTDIAFRKLCREYGAGLTTTEMVSAKGLCYNNKNTAALLTLDKSETPSCVQLFGSEPEFLVRAINLDELKHFDIIDINMGCPMKKITKNGEGSALMRDIKKAASIIKACVKTGRNITAKFRIGWDDKSINAVEFARALESEGAKLVTVHGRTTSQLYAGLANWDIIGDVAAVLSIPVIGNGDIKSSLDAAKKIKQYKVSGVAIGRGAIGNPMIFAQTQSQNDNSALLKIILKHIAYMQEHFDDRYTVTNMRKHLTHYLKGVSGTKELKKEINTITSVELLKQQLTKFLEDK